MSPRGPIGLILLIGVIATAQQGSTPVPTVFHHTNAPISNTDPRAKAFGQASALLKSMVNISADPCNNFYEFTCGSHTGPKSFTRLRSDNYEALAVKIEDPSYRSSNLPGPVKQLFEYYDVCKSAIQNWDSYTQDAKVVKAQLQQFHTSTGTSFPLLNQGSSDPAMPNALLLGKMLGMLDGVFRTSTLLTSYVDTNWRDPHSPQGYLFQVDQPSLIFSLSYYVKTWSAVESWYESRVVSWMNILQPGLDQAKLLTEVRAMAQLERTLATELMVDDATRRKYARQYNVYTTAEAKDAFGFLDWPEYIKQISTHASPTIKTMMLKDDFEFNVLEPKMIVKLGDYLETGKITPRTMFNYLNLRIVDAFSAYMPAPMRSNFKVDSPLDMNLRAGKPSPRTIIKDDPISLAVTAVEKQCAGRSIDALPYANTRVYVDAKYPTVKERDEIRKDFADMMDTVLIGFRSMVDQLTWMSSLSKTGAYGKIDDLVKNVAYPDFITDDAALTKYYEGLTAMDKTSYTKNEENIYIFNVKTMFDLLLHNGTIRDDFSGGSATVNAWYQPSMNSITFPAGIMQQPFWDPKWPVSVNYGSMGVIVGHELTHGFDDQGVQWDGTGMLYQWMDPKSYTSFETMANCVVNEYGSFCPITQGPPPYCLDGSNTQGENIADNGGIQAAYRAYMNYQNLNGPDPLLNDPIMRQYTHDQLFFMGFAQVWCQVPPTDEQIQNQILTDPHSPSLYRVFGTIQNFPAFRAAFHCPLNTKYAPAKHCDVWVNPIKGSIGIPDTSKIGNPLNLPKAPQIQPNETKKFNAYMGAVDFFKSSMNISENPCNNFYEYVCGSYKKGLSFRAGDEENFYELGTQMELPKYNNPSVPPSAVDKTVSFYKKCKATRKDFANYIKDGKIISSVMSTFKTGSGLDFSMVDAQGTQKPQPLTATILGKAIGLLSSQGIHTLFTPFVDTYWPTAKTFTLFVDQSTLRYAKTYYSVDAWATIKQTYKQDVMDLFKQYAKFISKTLNENTLSDDVDKLLNLEVQLARKYSTGDTIRRQYKRSWNLKSVVTATEDYPFVDFASYFGALSTEYSNLTNFFKQPAFKFSANEPEQFKKLSDAWASLDSNTVANYFFYRLLVANQEYLPKPATYTARTPESEISGLGRWPRFARTFELSSAARYADVQTECSYETVYGMQYSTGRIFVDFLYPNAADIQRIVKSANDIMQNTLQSFKGMLDRLTWMDAASKTVAYTKITDIAVNVVYPAFVSDNTKLNAYYAALSFTAQDDYITMKNKMDHFNFVETYKVIMNNYPVDRAQFFLPAAVINAWYQPEMNSITFPAAILRQPFYDEDWPASLNYGAFGLVSGHELTHGFDDQGVQWDGIGALKDWLSSESQTGFRDMADCIVKEYNHFCPLNGTGKVPSCINGDQTQGENIADNGGIQAAWRGYKDHVALNGPDPQLPDPVLSKLSHDQLFFMSFGAVWCEVPRNTDALYTQIMTDPHSPSKYRIFGTVQNFPAFRKAFNCPVGSPYAPQKHCSVWVPNPTAQP